MKQFIIRFRVPLLILALLLSLGGNIRLGLSLYRSAAIRSDAADYHAGAVHNFWRDSLANIGGAVAARDRDDDIKAYRERLGLAQQALYGSGLSAEAVSQARGDGAFHDLAAVLDRYAQSLGALSVAESGISAEDTARLATIQAEIEALADVFPAEFMGDATEQQVRDRAAEVCRKLGEKNLELCE